MCKVFFRGVRLTVIGRGTIGVRWTVEVKNSEAWLYAHWLDGVLFVVVLDVVVVIECNASKTKHWIQCIEYSA